MARGGEVTSSAQTLLMSQLTWLLIVQSRSQGPNRLEFVDNFEFLLLAGSRQCSGLESARSGQKQTVVA